MLTCYVQELNSIFFGYEVESSRILRDSHGNSRGVGFARCGAPIEYLRCLDNLDSLDLHLVKHLTK